MRQTISFLRQVFICTELKRLIILQGISRASWVSKGFLTFSLHVLQYNFNADFKSEIKKQPSFCRLYTKQWRGFCFLSVKETVENSETLRGRRLEYLTRVRRIAGAVDRKKERVSKQWICVNRWQSSDKNGW